MAQPEFIEARKSLAGASHHRERTFTVNVHSLFWIVQAVLGHMSEGASLVVTGSTNGLRGSSHLIDCAATKAAAMNLVQSLAQALAGQGIRVDTVAPGPAWTPLIPATIDAGHVPEFGQNVPLGRSAHPDEIVPSHVFFASNRLSSYDTGQSLLPAGGEVHPR